MFVLCPCRLFSTGVLIQKKRVELEQEAKATQEGKFCATPFGFDFVGITVRANRSILKIIRQMESSFACLSFF